jgi:hypothetical protein
VEKVRTRFLSLRHQVLVFAHFSSGIRTLGTGPGIPRGFARLEALRGDRTIQEIATRHKVHPNQVSTWKRQALDGLGAVFSNGAEGSGRDHEAEIKELHAKIGQLTVERDPRSGRGQAFWPDGSSDEPGGAQGNDPARPSRSELEPSMPPAVDWSLLALLRFPGREPRDSGSDAPHRCAVPEVSVLRLSPDGASTAAGRCVSAVTGCGV